MVGLKLNHVSKRGPRFGCAWLCLGYIINSQWIYRIPLAISFSVDSLALGKAVILMSSPFLWRNPDNTQQSGNPVFNIAMQYTQYLPLKPKSHHFDDIFVIGCTRSYHFGNLRCRPGDKPLYKPIINLVYWWRYASFGLNELTHWGRVTHICVTYLAIIGSDNGLSPSRRQAIIWTNAGILLIRTLRTNFSEI